ncbi:50S ribosomal protein L18 [Thermincola ferriacetica]|uniref:Large ribosomal subunit protein uL18 n=1 Tax=Thermincola ferriacetica TaxID=281456 RepID=A0A0L6W1R1_9FIRM|nr:50S ribosomal protein L18 [Thermincola ferriacetica]KNZ69465.1 50S ribosomal protein L18 [Thermincola ferriacetica]
MFKQVDRKAIKAKRHLRVRKKVFGTPERPRLSVFRSLNHIYAQIIDDTKGHTIVAASTLEPELGKSLSSKSNVEAAQAVGKAIAEKALAKGVKRVVFDRGGHIYHGRIKALADAAREAGLDF